MRLITHLLLIVVFLSSCNFPPVNNEKRDFRHITGIFHDRDSTPVSNPLIDIKDVYFRHSVDSVIVEITVKQIPEFIHFNNPKIPRGYIEYEWALELDVGNDAMFYNNVYASISYNNVFCKERGRMYTSFSEFLEFCTMRVIVIKRTANIVYEITNYSFNKNTICFSFSKNDLQNTIYIDPSIKWCVRTMFNNPDKQSTNLFAIDFYSPFPDNFIKYIPEIGTIALFKSKLYHALNQGILSLTHAKL